MLTTLTNYCEIVGVKGEKCEKLRDFLSKNPCPIPKTPANEPQPILWKGRDLAEEWKNLYRTLTGGK